MWSASLAKRLMAVDVPASKPGIRGASVTEHHPTSLSALMSVPEAAKFLGLSRASGEALVESLPRAASETEDAVRYGLATGAGREVLLARQLGIGRLLLKLDEGSALSDHIEAVLGRLLNHDASSTTPLLPTLVAYLELFGNKSDVARRLHIARRSLYHRLERIRALLDIDLDDAEARLQLMIAVAGLRLRERANRARLVAQGAKSDPVT